MKLYLSSLGIPNAQAYQALFSAPTERRVAIISNAWDVYPAERSRPVLYSTQELFTAMKCKHELLDLRQYVKQPEQLSAVLQKFDGLWVMGGNVFYLNWLLRETGVATIIRPLMEAGLMYGGESAGAVVAGHTLHGAQDMDDLAQAPAPIWEGLQLCNFSIVPHWGNPKYAAALEQCHQEMGTYGNVEVIRDDQFITVRENVATVWDVH